MAERRMVHRDGNRLIVTTTAELDAALADGWGLHKVSAAPVVAAPSPVSETLIVADDEPIRRGPGRPRKGT